MTTFEARAAHTLWSATWPVVRCRTATAEEFAGAVAGLRRVVAALGAQTHERERAGVPAPLVAESLAALERELDTCARAGRTAGWAGRIALAYRAVCAALESTARARGIAVMEGAAG